MASEETRFYLAPERKQSFPCLHELLTIVRQYPWSRDDTSSAQWSRAFGTLLRSGELERIIGEALAEMAKSDAFHTEWAGPRSTEWLIAESSTFILRAFILAPPPSPVIGSLPQDSFIGNLGRTALQFVSYRFPANCDPAVFNRHTVLAEGNVESIAPREAKLFLWSRDVPDYVASSPTLIVQLSSKMYAPIVWSFERTRREALLCSASYEVPVRDRAVAELLGHLALEPSLQLEPVVTTLQSMMSNQNYYVRWRVLQSLCSIDMDIAEPYLLDACKDPNPIIAEAARKAVTRLSAG